MVHSGRQGAALLRKNVKDPESGLGWCVGAGLAMLPGVLSLVLVLKNGTTIARTWKQSKCPSMDEWIKKMWHIYTIGYYSAIEKNKTGSFVEMWMDL